MAKRKRRKSNKGSIYERAICKKLSLWLSSDTNDPDNDDHLWRSAGSGARATVRKRKGKKTNEHSADVAPTSKLGRRFVRIISIEVKAGYGKATNVTLTDELDTPKKNKTHTLLDFIKQSRAAQENSKARHWMVIHKRDYREPLIYCDTELFDSINVTYLGHTKFIGGIVQMTKKLKVGVLRLNQLLSQDVSRFKRFVLS